MSSRVPSGRLKTRLQIPRAALRFRRQIALGEHLQFLRSPQIGGVPSDSEGAVFRRPEDSRKSGGSLGKASDPLSGSAPDSCLESCQTALQTAIWRSSPDDRLGAVHTAQAVVWEKLSNRCPEVFRPAVWRAARQLSGELSDRCPDLISINDLDHF